MRKIGIYSGSFDPVHRGHIAFATEAAKLCSLDAVVFLPERMPRDKPDISPISERVTELEIALRELPFSVIELPMDRFTVADTLPELTTRYPDSFFVFLIGSDVALKLAQWPNIQQLAAHYEFAVGMRIHESETEVQNALKQLNVRYTLVVTSFPDVSSSSLK